MLLHFKERGLWNDTGLARLLDALLVNPVTFGQFLHLTWHVPEAPGLLMNPVLSVPNAIFPLAFLCMRCFPTWITLQSWHGR